MAGTKRKDHGLFDYLNLPHVSPRRVGGLRMISLGRGIWTLALVVIVLFAASGSAMADHTYLPWKIFKFTGAPAAGVQDRHDFSIDQDGALYFTLKSFTAGAAVPGQAPVMTIGFLIKNPCPYSYYTQTTDPTVGMTFGPYYVAAGDYQSVFALIGAATAGYELEIAYHLQLTQNDAELNDSPETAQNVGVIYPGEHISGHLAYMAGAAGGCHNKHDYIRFRMLSTGNYQVRIHYDPAFRDKPECKVWFGLHDDTASMWVLSHTGPADVTLGPMAFRAGSQYLVSMESSDGCYTKIWPYGYANGMYIANNKAGAYDIQIYDPSAPPPVTIRWGSVEKATAVVPKGSNKKYLILNVENYGTSPQTGYVEITVVDENRGQPVFSDQKYIAVPAGTTGRFDVYADTTNWPVTRMKATASLYSEDKKTFLGSNYAKFHCGVPGMPGEMMMLLGL